MCGFEVNSSRCHGTRGSGFLFVRWIANYPVLPVLSGFRKLPRKFPDSKKKKRFTKERVGKERETKYHSSRWTEKGKNFKLVDIYNGEEETSGELGISLTIVKLICTPFFSLLLAESIW